MNADVAVSFAFQPIVHAVEQRVFSYEALIRGPENQGAEWVLERAPRSAAAAFHQDSRNRALAMAAAFGVECLVNLNFPPASLVNSGAFLAATLEVAQSEGLRPGQLCIEITESEAIDDQERFGSLVNAYRGRGVKVAIDDFGAGYSGLNLLANFQPDMVKLDLQLVRGIQHDGPRQAIVSAVSQLCFDLGIDLIAEGVESIEEYRWLADHQISLFQGYLWAKPGFERLPEVHWPV